MKKNNAGIVTLIFILLMAVLATLILIVGQSRLLLAIQRSRASSDNLIANYSAESEINDLLLRLSKGFFTENDFNQFPITKSLDNGALILEIDGRIEGTNQILTVTARRSFAVSKIQAVRAVATAGQVTPVELMLMLDCTQSMDSNAGAGDGTTRMYQQKQAAINFVEQIRDHPNGDFVKLGLGVFTVTPRWVQTASGTNITPFNNIGFDTIINTIEARFGNTKATSSACNGLDIYTSIGSGYTFAQDYFAQSPLTNHKKVEVLITDGEPNSRIVYPACPPSTQCTRCETEGYNFLECAITDINTRWDVVNFGIRNPDITAYGVTVLKPESSRIRQLFEEAIGSSNYYNATTADQLEGILEDIFNQVITTLSKTTISRVIPIEED